MNRQILRLAIPNILSNISVPLLSTVDTALMGRLSDIHLGAVGVGAMIFNFAYWNFGFLRMGTTGLTAQAYGRNDGSEMIISLGKALILALIISLGLILFQVPLTNIAIYLMQVNPEQAPLVKTYIYIRIWAAPASLGLYALLGWFFGMQNAIYPLLITILINVVNIILSYSLIVYYGMEIDGVAWGTVIAQYCGLLSALLFVWFRYRSLFKVNKINVRMYLKGWGAFLNINRDIFIRTLFLTISFAFLYSQSSSTGTQILAVNVILLQLINWMSYGIDGFAFAAESLVGRYYGARDSINFKSVIRLIFLWGFGFALIFSATYFVFGRFIFSLFVKDMSLYEVGEPYMIWMAILPILGFGSYIWDGIFIGLTASRSMRDSMFISFVIYLGTYYLLVNHLGQHALWLSLCLFLFTRTVIQYLMYKKHGWDIK